MFGEEEYIHDAVAGWDEGSRRDDVEQRRIGVSKHQTSKRKAL